MDRCAFPTLEFGRCAGCDDFLIDPHQLRCRRCADLATAHDELGRVRLGLRRWRRACLGVALVVATLTVRTCPHAVPAPSPSVPASRGAPRAAPPQAAGDHP